MRSAQSFAGSFPVIAFPMLIPFTVGKSGDYQYAALGIGAKHRKPKLAAKAA